MNDLITPNDKISIIVPVCNYEKKIESFLDALIKQDFDKNSYEIIVVDNGSHDNTIELIQKKEVTLILEHSNRNSPYSARNRGIEQATGNIIALIDANKTPNKNWLSEGIKCLNENNADIVGGNVIFQFDGKKTAAKIFDAKSNIKMEESIKTRGIAKTANLFVRSEVFHKIGQFPAKIRSGGDVIWTRKAVDAGFKLAYCEYAIVNYLAKSFRKLIKKQWRVGLGQPLIWYEEFRSIKKVLKRFSNRLFLLYLFKSDKKTSPLKYISKSKEKSEFKFQMLIIGLAVHVTMITANFIGLFLIKKNIQVSK